MIVVVDSTGQPLPVNAIRFGGGIAVVDLGNGAVRVGGPATTNLVTTTRTRSVWATVTYTQATRVLTRTMYFTVSYTRDRTVTQWIDHTVTASKTAYHSAEVSKDVSATRTGTVWQTQTFTKTKTCSAFFTVTRWRTVTNTRTNTQDFTQDVSATRTRWFTVTVEKTV